MGAFASSAPLAAALRRRLAFDPSSDEAVGEHRTVRASDLARGDWLAVALLGGGVLATAGLLLARISVERHPGLAIVALYVAVYAVVSRIEFEVFSGGSVPTELVLVPMLFVLPLRVVPLAVVAGLMLAASVDAVRGRSSLQRALLGLVGGWHAVGPVLVLWLADARVIDWSKWPIYVLALGAQFAFEFVAITGQEWLARRTKPAAVLPHLGRTQLIDATLAPIALVFAFAAQSSPATVVLVVPLAALLSVFARERRARIDNALELSAAYRGTAFLLGDVVEADDTYTGLHSRDVVELSVAVADQLGVSAGERRDTEFVALLHDVGKIRIPAEIINKPGKLDPEERALIETHTIEGETMLEQVGGLLGNVGRIVRSCHERWDGAGYPDGLAGESIPRVARIVMCCDAFSAMTTDRSYRKALPLETAVAELRANAGTQFDPSVVEALVAVISTGAAGRACIGNA